MSHSAPARTDTSDDNRRINIWTSAVETMEGGEEGKFCRDCIYDLYWEDELVNEMSRRTPKILCLWSRRLIGPTLGNVAGHVLMQGFIVVVITTEATTGLAKPFAMFLVCRINTVHMRRGATEGVDNSRLVFALHPLAYRILVDVAKFW